MKTEASPIGLSPAKRPLAVVAMSGGVDSSVAAALLIERGFEVEAVSLRLWDSSRTDDRICSDHRDAGKVAAFLGIRHTVIDQRERFERRVVEPLVTAYASGRTPNPCAACNSEFKLGWLLDWASARGATAVATGHYARVERAGDSVSLRRGADPSRDQSYFLFQLRRRQLERTVFPLGEWRKDEVRRRARDLGLPVADKRDSQDLCFGDPARLVAARGKGGRGGDMLDPAGRVLGRHAGVERFTIGQRRGLGVAAGAPLYVQSIDASARAVRLAPEPPRAAGLVTREWSWINQAAGPEERVTVQIRYRHPGTAARLRMLDGGVVQVDFDDPAVAVAPGQAAVAYRGDQVLGGGWIERVISGES